MNVKLASKTKVFQLKVTIQYKGRATDQQLMVDHHARNDDVVVYSDTRCGLL